MWARALVLRRIIEGSKRLSIDTLAGAKATGKLSCKPSPTTFWHPTASATERLRPSRLRTRSSQHLIATSFATPNVHKHIKIGLEQNLKKATPGGKAQLLQAGGVGDEEINDGRAHLNGAGTTMPGILGAARESKGGVSGEAHDFKMERRDLIMTDGVDDLPATNGTHTPMDVAYTNGVASTPPEPQWPATHATQKIVEQLPPEIEHWTMGYVLLSRLIGRMVQETFNGIGDIINDMAEMAIPQPLTNGIVNPANHRVGGVQPGDNSQANIQKKIRLFDFANSRRAQFIKVLVLSRWARQAESVSKVIDLRIWLSQKQEDYDSAVTWMGELKRKLAAVKEPNPDIKTALEVLSLGKASWLPDLGYLPPEQLMPQQILHVLCRINTLLSIRLNLHETIPPIFRNFSISSGRVTFRVPEEFEIDLSLAGDDPCEQLYFIDFRPIFSPASAALPTGRLRDELEARANAILSREGLQGLFDFTHNLVLTHKLTILRNQAFEMARGHWSEHLKIEPLRRSVVVQYWCDKPGGKNWVEVGLKRGKVRRLAHTDEGQRIPELALRWFRGGKEALDAKVDLRPGDLSMEYILKQIIAQHSNYAFAEMAAKLNHGLLYASGRLKLKRGKSISHPADTFLLIQLTKSKAIKVMQEPVSGRFAILPASGLNSRAEYELNRLDSPAKEGSNQLSYLRAIASQEEVETSVRQIGWEVVGPLRLNQETMQKLFPRSTQRARFYRRSSWETGWALAFTTGPDGDCWWVVELSDAKLKYEEATSKTIEPQLGAAYRVCSDNSKPLIMEPTPISIAQIERDAAGVISHFTDSRHLAASGTPHRVDIGPSVNRGERSMSIYIRLFGRQAPPMLPSSIPLTLPCATEIIKLDYRGLNPTHSAVKYIASLRLNQPFSNVNDLAINVPGAAFHRASGVFAIQLQNKIGEASIPNLIQTLSAVERLLNFTAVIKAHGLKTNATSLELFEFTYQQLPMILKATIHFPVNAALRMTLSAPNPHLRIVDYLTALLRSQGLVVVLALMRVSLPLLATFAQMELTVNSAQMNILTRSEQFFQVRYASPVAKGGFDVQLRQRRDELQWFIPGPSIKRSGPVCEEEIWQQSLRTFISGKGKGWRGMNGGIVSTLNGVQDAVEKLHAIFLGATNNVREGSRPAKRKAEGEITELN
ncbi:MAG: hypothetical protein Q9163_003884 [Psora crenata]